MSIDSNKYNGTLEVALVVPPFYHYSVPSLACGLLKSLLENNGISCKVFYFNALFAKFVGQKQYDSFKFGGYSGNLAGEQIFSRHAHGDIPSRNQDNPIDDFYAGFLKKAYNYQESLSSEEKFISMERCRLFLDKAVEEIIKASPRIIGFSSIFQQVNSSIAFSKIFKKVLPGAITVMGGSNCDGERGRELADKVESLDYIFQGEADSTFPIFCQDFLYKNKKPKAKIIQSSKFQDMNTLPVPDYSDFFQQIDGMDISDAWIYYESSRGCWWGEKNHCKFCSQSGFSLTFREKNPGVLIEELNHLQEKYPKIKKYYATDNIIPNSYFKDFFPKLRSSGFNAEIFYEAKVNSLTYGNLLVLKEAKVNSLNPGFESLSNRLLKSLGKGCNALMNIRVMRDCREIGIVAIWNLLIGIPGDTASDYEEQGRLFPLLQHLFPPALTPIFLQRFSPYHNDPQKYGIKNIKPHRAFQKVFPESFDLDRFASNFEADIVSESRENLEILTPLIEHCRKWVLRWGGDDFPELKIQQIHDEKWEVKDTRDCALQEKTFLNKEEAGILKYHRTARPKHDGSGPIIDKFLKTGLMVEVDNKLLSLVVEYLNYGDSSNDQFRAIAKQMF